MISAINNLSEVRFGSRKPQNVEFSKNSASQKGDAIELNCDPSQKLLTKKTTIIPAKCFKISKNKDKYLPTVSNDAELNYKYIEKGSCWSKRHSQFSKKIQAETLEILNKHILSTKISNEYPPFGTVAISSQLNDCLTTDGLYQCAGIALIDKKHNLQTLAHICPIIPNQSNKELLNYILSFSKPEDLEIYIAPGEYEETDKTIEFIVNTIKENNEKYNINFVDFPDHKNVTLVLKNGKLMCTKSIHNHTTKINPHNRIINA